MAEHVLKTLASYWDAIACGEKTFEVRLNDRGFQKGDVLVLRRLGRDGLCEGREERGFWRYKQLRRHVTYILTGGQFGIEPDYVVMAIERCNDEDPRA